MPRWDKKIKPIPTRRMQKGGKNKSLINHRSGNVNIPQRSGSIKKPGRSNIMRKSARRRQNNRRKLIRRQYNGEEKKLSRRQRSDRTKLMYKKNYYGKNFNDLLWYVEWLGQDQLKK